MEEKKKIDRLFQEKFKDFEVFPDPVVWQNIENQIRKKKKRRILPLWLRLGAAAAILLLLVMAGMQFFGNDQVAPQPQEQIITKTDQQQKSKSDQDQNQEEKSSPSPKMLEKANDNLITKTDKKTPASSKNLDAETSVAQIKTATQVNQKENAAKDILSKESLQEQLLLQEKNDALAASQVQKETLEQKALEQEANKLNAISPSEDSQVAFEDQQELKEASKEEGKIDMQSQLEKVQSKLEEPLLEKVDKWSIGTSLAPVFYNTLNGGSPIDASLAENTKNADGNMSYGLKVNYEISERLSIQSGINNVALGYSTENVTALLSSSLLDNTSSNLTTNVEGVAIAAVAALPVQSVESFSQRSSSRNLSGNLSQTLNYLEFPMEAKYKIVNKKIGVNLIGGFSTYVLYKNQVGIVSSNNDITLGEATNLNPVNFSGNLGLDFDYKISKKLFINVSPMFKYQFNTYSENSGGFEPYFLGVYTGLNFRF